MTRSLATVPTRGVSTPPRPPHLCLLGGFVLLLNGAPVTLPVHAQRVLASLSLQDPGPPWPPRVRLAERLWSDAPADRSQASLRTALWRIRQADPTLVRASREV